MDKRDFERLSAKAEVFKALAHPSRLYILELLLGRERGVTELAGLVGAEMPTVSKHLSALKNIGVISSRKEGNSVIYRIERECVRDTMACADKARRSGRR